MLPARAPVMPLARGMNKTEAIRAEDLELQKRAGYIAEWWYEGWTFKLADDTRYTPDFVIQHPDGMLTAEEIKGFYRDDAKVKARVFVAQFPIQLRLLTLVKGNPKHSWHVVEY